MSKITLDQVKAYADTLDPNATNDGECVMTRDFEHGHCIVARIVEGLAPAAFNEYVTKLLDLPDESGPDGREWHNGQGWYNLHHESDPIAQPFDHDANDWLAYVQGEADNGGDGNVPWGKAIAITNEVY